MQFYFIRHGQSANNALWDKTGASKGRHMDPELTETGKQQAQKLAEFISRASPELKTGPRDGQNLAGFGITHLYTSLMLRAVQTGTYLAEALGLQLRAWEDLHEEGGIYLDDEVTGEPTGHPGQNRNFFETNFPGLVLQDTINPEGWWSRPFEAPEQRAARARRLLQELLERHGDTDDRVAVISHGGFFNNLIPAIFQIPESSGVWFLMNNVGITRIDFHPERVVLAYANRLDFLPREWVT